ncbi:uncharacterized protein LOC142140556 isoform X2 [Mixophyes fleayi]|uniref:uncharacterized protein LOC142140556 isoform X2 n=1 Tax=Mixophyes fleayi TaxID=3061075 RepID=UPI003F4D82D0
MVSTLLIWSLITAAATVTVVQDPPSLLLEVGQTAQMSCKTEGAENIKILHYYWSMNTSVSSTSLVNSSRVTITPGSLVISSVTTNDTGLYICSVRVSNLNFYIGNETRLLVTEPPTVPAPPDHHHQYLYSLLILIPLLLGLIICWKYSSRTGPRTAPTSPGVMENESNCTQKDSDTDLHYSTIFPHPAGVRTKPEKTRKRRAEEVEYAPVRIAVPALPVTATHEQSNMDQDSICYATLKTYREY